MNKRYYIAGPMSGYPSDNHGEFNRVSYALANAGIDHFNPATTDGGSIQSESGKPRSFYLREAFRNLLDCTDAILLNGWWQSSGACQEVHMAGSLGCGFYNTDLEEIQVPREFFEIIDRATVPIATVLCDALRQGKYKPFNWLKEMPERHAAACAGHSILASRQYMGWAKPDKEDHYALALCRAGMAIARRDQ